MRRRDLLAGTTGTLSLCGLAGCTGSTLERLQTERPSADDGPPADSSDGRDGDESETESTDAIVVGDPDEVPFLDAHPPHELAVRNDGETDRTVSVTITTDGDDTNDVGDGDGSTDRGDDTDAPLLERDLDLAAGEGRTLVLVEPRPYTVTLTASGDGSESTVTGGIDRQRFDCTRSRTTITVRDSGVQTGSTASSVPCPVPEVSDASLDVSNRACADRTDGDDAVVEFADEAVFVDGDVTIPTPCHTLSLAETAYDEASDRLEIVVAVGEQDADTCIDCLGTADYEARIDLRGRYPGRVAVVHEAGDETRQVTTVEYLSE